MQIERPIIAPFSFNHDSDYSQRTGGEQDFPHLKFNAFLKHLLLAQKFHFQENGFLNDWENFIKEGHKESYHSPRAETREQTTQLLGTPGGRENWSLGREQDPRETHSWR